VYATVTWYVWAHLSGFGLEKVIAVTEVVDRRTRELLVHLDDANPHPLGANRNVRRKL
jgi:hypothetical protein